MKKTLFFLFFVVTFYKSNAQTIMQIGTTTVQVDTLIIGIDIPWEIIYTNDGYIWMTERKGVVSRVNTTNGTKEILLDITSNVTQQAESGLLGMALHPDFENVPEVFLAYTYTPVSSIREKIVKYTFNGTALVNEIVLLDNIEGNGTHNGCRLLFLSDTTLLATTGDVQNPNLAQNLSSHNGKILRMHTDGSVPSDNPVASSYVYAFGLRNTQGLAHLPNNTIIMSEHGASTEDEVQLLNPNRNYGWPNVEGFCNTTSEITFCNANNVVEPLTSYTPTIAPSDLVFYTNNSFPEWDSCVLMTVLKDKELHAFKMNDDFSAIISDMVYLESSFGRLRDITIGANKEIYIATNGQSWSNIDPNTHSIIRITPPAPSTNSINSFSTNNPISFYPNPTKGLVSIKKNNSMLINEFKIINALGEEILTIGGNANALDFGNLSKGVYIIKTVYNDSHVSFQKIILE